MSASVSFSPVFILFVLPLDEEMCVVVYECMNICKSVFGLFWGGSMTVSSSVAVHVCDCDDALE